MKISSWRPSSWDIELSFPRSFHQALTLNMPSSQIFHTLLFLLSWAVLLEEKSTRGGSIPNRKATNVLPRMQNLFMILFIRSSFLFYWLIAVVRIYVSLFAEQFQKQIDSTLIFCFDVGGAVILRLILKANNFAFVYSLFARRRARSPDVWQHFYKLWFGYSEGIFFGDLW